jgi:hypothetical protein
VVVGGVEAVPGDVVGGEGVVVHKPTIISICRIIGSIVVSPTSSSPGPFVIVIYFSYVKKRFSSV